MKLYHYVHCPFCVRVRMGLGLLKLNYISIVVPYNDESTPTKLTGKKMLPIMLYDDGFAQNESLDILKKLDTHNLLNWPLYEQEKLTFDPLLDRLGAPVHSLAMPYWIWTPEFNEQSRVYFQKKKEVKRGPFKDLVKNKQQFIRDLNPILEALCNDLKPFYKNDCLSILDIMLAAHLWGLYIVPEFQFPPLLHAYLMRVKAETSFNYHEDFWR